MSDKKLWSPTTTKNTLNLFTEYINDELKIDNYAHLHRWSIEKKEIFWSKFWEKQKEGKHLGYLQKKIITKLNLMSPRDYLNGSPLQLIKEIT